jgi:hypothetical protein
MARAKRHGLKNDDVRPLSGKKPVGNKSTANVMSPKNIDAYLTKRYYDVTQPASYTSVYKLYNTIKHEGKYNIPLERIKKWGMGQDAITMNKRPTYKGVVRRKVVSGLTWSLFDADLLVLNQERFRMANDNMGYILVCVDVLSSFARVACIKTKGAKDVLGGFKEIFERSGNKYPRNLRTDSGIEFKNKLITSFMDHHDINHYFATSTLSHANYSEVFCRTLKNRLFKVFQHRNSYTYIDILQPLVESYNNSYSSSIKMAPSQVSEENEQEIWFNKYFPPSMYKSAFKSAVKLQRRRKSSTLSKEHFKYSIGAHVRITYFRETFTRDYDISYSGEIYTIYDRRVLQGQPIYYLQDYNNVKLSESFYQWEIQEIKFNPKQAFKIDKVLKTRTKNGVKESLVKYQFWPSSYNEWVPNKRLISLK